MRHVAQTVPRLQCLQVSKKLAPQLPAAAALEAAAAKLLAAAAAEAAAEAADAAAEDEAAPPDAAALEAAEEEPPPNRNGMPCQLSLRPAKSNLNFKWHEFDLHLSSQFGNDGKT